MLRALFFLICSGCWCINANADEAPFLGANYNESLDLVNVDDLARTHSRWARGFIVYDQYKSGKRDLTNDERINGLIKLKKLGINTILSLKFNFQHRPFPQTAKDIDAELSLLPALLDKLMPYADIIVAGNEPFIETGKSLRKVPLVAFYKTVAGRIHDYQQSHGFKQPIYLGAFNRLWESRMQTDSEPLLMLAHDTPWIAGIDLHIHHSTQQQFSSMTDFALAHIRPDQRFISTEFSLMHHWRQSLDNTIPAGFAAKYDYPPSMNVHTYLNKTLNQASVPRQEWIDFLSHSPWFENYKHYIRDAMQTFKGYKQFAGATYGLYQTYGHKPFTKDSAPWVLNSLFSNRTVETNKGIAQFHYQFMDDFIAEQEAR